MTSRASEDEARAVGARAEAEAGAVGAGAEDEANARAVRASEDEAVAEGERPGERPASDAEAEDAGPAPRTKAAQREATIAALTAAARELFAQRGYAAVGTEEIVQRAGLTRGALYHHFRGGKEELFRAALVQISADTARQVRSAARAKADPWDALVAGIDAFLDACATPEVQRIVLVDGPSVLGWDVWRAIDEDYSHGLVEAALRRAVEAGTILAQPTDALAHVLLGALHEAAMVVARADDPALARSEMGRMVRRLLEGLRGPAA